MSSILFALRILREIFLGEYSAYAYQQSPLRASGTRRFLLLAQVIYEQFPFLEVLQWQVILNLQT